MHIFQRTHGALLVFDSLFLLLIVNLNLHSFPPNSPGCDSVFQVTQSNSATDVGCELSPSCPQLPNKPRSNVSTFGKARYRSSLLHIAIVHH